MHAEDVSGPEPDQTIDFTRLTATPPGGGDGDGRDDRKPLPDIAEPRSFC